MNSSTIAGLLYKARKKKKKKRNNYNTPKQNSPKS